MNNLDQMMEFNKQFVRNRDFKKYSTDKFPDKKMVILSCMDTRLVELLPRALNLKNGDAKIIKNAGAVITHPFGSIMRSIIVAIYELNAEEVYVIGHHQCGMSSVNSKSILQKMRNKGISDETISTLNYAGVDLNYWFQGFGSVAASVKNSVHIIKNHPLLPKNTPVHGLIIDPQTGELEVVVNGYSKEGAKLSFKDESSTRKNIISLSQYSELK